MLGMLAKNPPPRLHLQHHRYFAAPGHARVRVEARRGSSQAPHIGEPDGARPRPRSWSSGLAGVEAEAPGNVAARLGLQRFGKQPVDGVPETDVGGGQLRGVSPMGVWSTSSTQVNGLKAGQPGAAASKLGPAGVSWHRAAALVLRCCPGLHIGQQQHRAPGWICRSRSRPSRPPASVQRHGHPPLQVVQVRACGAASAGACRRPVLHLLGPQRLLDERWQLPNP